MEQFIIISLIIRFARWLSKSFVGIVLLIFGLYFLYYIAVNTLGWGEPLSSLFNVVTSAAKSFFKSITNLIGG